MDLLIIQATKGKDWEYAWFSQVVLWLFHVVSACYAGQSKGPKAEDPAQDKTLLPFWPHWIQLTGRPVEESFKKADVLP